MRKNAVDIFFCANCKKSVTKTSKLQYHFLNLQKKLCIQYSFLKRVIFIEKTLKILLVFLLIAAIFTSPIPIKNSQAAVLDYPLLNFCIVLDAGHGGEDGGAIGISTLVREKDINLSIAKKTALLFEAAGAKVVLTRNDENSLCKGKYNKLEDMRARKKIIDENQPYIVISIHCNSFPQSKNVQGAQMFYLPQSESGQMLAEQIQKSIQKNVDKNNTRQIKGEDFYMLKCGNSTNVMIECGFLSSPEEEKLLSDDNYQNMLAYAVFDGTSNFINSLRPQNE